MYLSAAPPLYLFWYIKNIPKIRQIAWLYCTTGQFR